jgi:hypothetical protein
MWWQYALIAIALVVGVLLAFPIAILLCACLGWVLMTLDRATTRCPGCNARQMRCANGIRETYPTGRGTGKFYLCEACKRRWFWSNDDRCWRDADDSDFDWAFAEPPMPINQKTAL